MFKFLAWLPAWVEQAVIFAIVGGLGFGLDAGVLTLLTKLGAPPLLARVISIAATVIFTWQLNRRLTFKLQAPPTLLEFQRYVMISLASIAINYAVFTVLVLLEVPIILAAAVGTVIAATFNFIRYRALLAKDRKAADDPLPAE